MATKTIYSNDLDKEISTEMAIRLKEMLDNTFRKYPLEVLNAFTACLINWVKVLRNNSDTEVEDGIEKLIMDWMIKTDAITGNHFSKYINL